MQKKMFSLRIKTIVAITFSFSLLAGCVSTDEEQSPQTRLSETEEKAIRQSLESHCPASLQAYDDQRTSLSIPASETTIGPDEMKQWVFAALTSAHFSLTPSPQDGRLSVILEKSFLQTYGDSVIANVVISAQYQAPDGDARTTSREFKGMAVQPATAPLAADELFQQAIARAVVRMNRTFRYGCALAKQQSTGFNLATGPAIQ